MKSLFWKGRGKGHVRNFYTVDLENFTTAKRRCTGVINELVEGQSAVSLWITPTMVERVMAEWMGLLYTGRL